MPVQKGRFFEGRAKHKLLRPYRSGGVITKNFATFDEAQDWEKKTRAQLAAGILPEEIRSDEPTTTRLGQAIKLYLTKGAVKPSEKGTLLLSYVRLGNTQLKDINYDWAERWVEHMKHTQHLKPGTIRKHVGALARCLDWMISAEKTTLIRNPLRLLPHGYAVYHEPDVLKLDAQGVSAPTDAQRDRRLEEGEEKRILHILAGGIAQGKRRAMKLNERVHLEVLFILALESAMRMSEMYTLTARQVDLAKHTVFLDKTKNGDKRQVPITSVAAPLLKRLIKGLKPDAYLFPWYGSEAYCELPDAARRKKVTAMLSQQFARIFVAAQCEDLNFHDLRHEATSRLFERTTLNNLEIAKITGHKSLSMLQRYANLRASELAGRLW